MNICKTLYMQLKARSAKRFFSSRETVESHFQKNWSGLAASVIKSIKIRLLTEDL